MLAAAGSARSTTTQPSARAAARWRGFLLYGFSDPNKIAAVKPRVLVAEPLGGTEYWTTRASRSKEKIISRKIRLLP
jgi:hypothetical protein